METASDYTGTGIIIVDHGSRRAASNRMLLEAAAAFADRSQYAIVEPAHMELAMPDIAAAFRRCVERGAQRVIVFPYFLSPGRHWDQDIPRLVAAAAERHPGIAWLVTAPFGLHPGLLSVIDERIAHCLAQATGTAVENQSGCDVCNDHNRCQMR